MRQLIFDVETQKAFDQVGGYHPERLGVSFVGAILRDGFPESTSSETRYQLFESDLPQLWPLLESADVLIGFNLLGFDLPVLSAYYPGDIAKLPVLDLLAVIKDQAGHRISLDAVAKETLGTKKSGSGLDALRYYHKQNWSKLASYCMKDVEITRDLYDHGRTHKSIKFVNKWNNLVEIPVDFRFKPSHRGLQLSLV